MTPAQGRRTRAAGTGARSQAVVGDGSGLAQRQAERPREPASGTTAPARDREVKRAGARGKIGDRKGGAGAGEGEQEHGVACSRTVRAGIGRTWRYGVASGAVRPARLRRCAERAYARAGGKADDGSAVAAAGISTANSSPSGWVASIRHECAVEYQDGMVRPWCNTAAVEETAAWRQCEKDSKGR